MLVVRRVFASQLLGFGLGLVPGFGREQAASLLTAVTRVVACVGAGVRAVALGKAGVWLRLGVGPGLRHDHWC